MGILDGIVEWIATQVMNILDMINTSVLGALGCDMETFIRYFPAAETFYSIIVAISIGLLLLNLTFQLFRNFGILSGGEAENPISLTIRTMIFLFLSLYADEILNIVLKIGGTPYTWFMTEELPPLDFANFNSVLLTILGASLSGSIALIALILLVILAWNYIRLLFEAAERYVLLGVLTFTAPLAFSMGGSQNTANIFKSWCRMLGGQVLMIIMNVWCLRIFTSMFAGFIANPLSLENGNFLIWFLCAVAFLKISQKVDSFVQMLGINVGTTGSSMLSEGAIALRTIDKTRKSSSIDKSESNNSSSQTAFLQGGLTGAVGRHFSQSAIQNITGKSDSISSNIARSVYNSSIQKGGSFSTDIISKVANGDIGKIGAIKGNDAVQAFESYMGMNNSNISSISNSSICENTDFSNIQQEKGIDFNNMEMSAEQVIAEYQQNTGTVYEPSLNSNDVSLENTVDSIGSNEIGNNNNNVLENGVIAAQENITLNSISEGSQGVYGNTDKGMYTSSGNNLDTPVYSNIEIGGGRIIGQETSSNSIETREFAMYSTDKYMPPSKGDYKTVTAIDGSKWYHQYAQPTVIKEPFMKEDGKIQYHEHIENKLPEPPKRKDKI